MQIKELIRDTVSIGSLFAVCAAAALHSNTQSSSNNNVWPANERAAAIPASLPAGTTLIAEYESMGKEVFCVPYKEDAEGRNCSDKVRDFDRVTKPLVVPIHNSNPLYNPLMQP